MDKPIKEEIDGLIGKLNEQMKNVEKLRKQVYDDNIGFFLTTENEEGFKKYVDEHAKVTDIVKDLQKKFQEYHHEG